MALEDIEVVEYQMEYPTLNLEAKKNNEKLFDYGFLYCYAKECKRGFKVKKVNKTNSKGTKFTYTGIKDKSDFEEYKKVLTDMVNTFNKKYGTKLKAQ